MIDINKIRKVVLTVFGALVLITGFSAVSEALVVKKVISEKHIVIKHPKRSMIETNIYRGDLLTSKRVVVDPRTKMLIAKRPVVIEKIMR